MKRSSICVLFAASLAAMSARAEQPHLPAYVGVGLGMTDFSVNKNSFPALAPEAQIDSKSYNLRLIMGYQFDPLLGVEMDLAAGGSVSANEFGMQSKLFDASLASITAQLGAPLNDRARLYAKFGGTFFALRSQDTNIDRGFGLTAGLGLDLNLYGGDDRRLRVEYSYYRPDMVHVRSANSLSISAMFFFPDASYRRSTFDKGRI